ncbi:MAG: cbb3-type cytochrome c oxidase subunit I [Rhodospirillaceae bacterium]|nr:cbb3-type cytochrome c oxidase subunit I [Rhodospirillaceae bacterium]
MIDDVESTERCAEPRLDVAVDGRFAGVLTPHFRHELFGWVALPLAALGIAGLLALLIALLRVPGAENVLPWSSQSFFEKGLVAHVTFAFVIWYMGVHGALTVLVTAQALGPGRGELNGAGILCGRTGLYGAALSLLLLLIPVLGDLGAPSPNNYIPVLVHPLYYAGLTLLAVSLALPVVRLLAIVRAQRDIEPLTMGVAAAGVIYLIALVCIAIAWAVRPGDMDIETLNDFVLWGGGHVLQFTNTALMLCALYLLTRITLGETPVGPRLFNAMMLLMVAGAAMGPLLYMTHDAGDPAQRLMFTDLYWYVLPLPTAVVLLGLMALLFRRRGCIAEGAPELTGVVVALALFGFGGIIGFFESSSDTRTPGHYHAVLIAVTLTFMALYFALFLPLLGLRTERRRLRAWMYVLLGTGQFLHSASLYVAGAMGVARKTAGAGQGLDSWQKIASLSVMGVGGLIAVVGGVIFVVLAGKLLLARGREGVTATLSGAAKDALDQGIRPSA